MEILLIEVGAWVIAIGLTGMVFVMLLYVLAVLLDLFIKER